MSVSARAVKDLREKTGAGMMDCKKALTESNGKIEDAIEFLRKKGLQASAKKLGRIATEGLVSISFSGAGNEASIIELNCETDFVAKNEELISVADEVSALILGKKPTSNDEVLSSNLSSGISLSDQINTLIAKIGEKISFRRFKVMNAVEGSVIGSYIHMGGKIGVLVQLAGAKATVELAKDVAMHVAASAPQFLEKDEVPQDILDKEAEIIREQLKDSGKPADVLKNIIQGKLSKYANEVCLNNQIFVKDPTGKKSISKFLKEIDPSLRVISFIRYQVGEGLEKKQDDFASEVASMAN